MLSRKIARGGSATLACLLLAASHASAGDLANVIGGNSSNNQLLALIFDEAGASSASVINTDTSDRVSLRSFGFFEDLCRSRLDLVVADTLAGELLLYPNPSPARAQAGELLCGSATGACPARPDGISFSDKRLMAVADTGSGGSTPGIWLFPPEFPAEAASCVDADGYGPFRPPVSTGQVLACDGPADDPGTTCVAVGAVVDTLFVDVPGGGLGARDLLLLTDTPKTISVIRAEDIDALLEAPSPASTGAEIIADETDFAAAGPEFAAVFSRGLALASIQNSADVGGAVDDRSATEEFVLPGTGGELIRFRFVNSPSGACATPPCIEVDPSIGQPR